jgi:hypothetical protein
MSALATITATTGKRKRKPHSAGFPFLIHAKKTTANANWPTEHQWAARQPAQWRDACLCFAVASNTRGGIVGKNMTQIVREANQAGIRMSLRTFKRHVAQLQAHGVIYQDEARPSLKDDGQHQQKPSTWLLRFGERMPDGVRLSDPAVPRFRPDARQWCVTHGIDTTPVPQSDDPPF